MNDATLTRLFDKIDGIKEDVTDIKVNVAKLPCKAHEEKFNGFNNRFKIMSTVLKSQWGVILLILSSIIAFKFIGGR